MPHSAHKAIGQLRLSAHQLEIRAGRALRMTRAERLYKLCEVEIESMELFCNAQISKGKPLATPLKSQKEQCIAEISIYSNPEPK